METSYTREIEVSIREPDKDLFLVNKLEEMWGNNKCLFIFGLTMVCMVVVGIIVGVVVLVVAPALPQTAFAQTSFQLRNNIDFVGFMTGDIPLGVFKNG